MNKIITQDQFLTAYFHHLPKAWICFAFRYFSKSTTDENIKPSKAITIALGILFSGGFITTVLGQSRKVRGIFTFAFMIILVPFVLFILAAGLANNARINKIRKELGGISIEEYNKLADNYF